MEAFDPGHGLDLLIILITYLFPFQPTRIGVSRPGLPGHHDRTSTGMGRLAPAASVVRFYHGSTWIGYKRGHVL